MRFGKMVKVVIGTNGQLDEYYNIHNDVGEVVQEPNGSITIRDLNGDKIRVYGPNGYKWYDEFEINRRSN